MFRVPTTKRFRKVIDVGGEVVTLKDLGPGSAFDLVYSAPMNRLYFNFTESGGDAAIYETTYDTTPTWIDRGLSGTTNGFPLYAVNSTRLEPHPTLPILYNSGGSSQIYKSNLLFTSAHVSKGGWPASTTHPRLLSGSSMIGVGTFSLARAPIDGAGTIGTLQASQSFNPASGYTLRGSAISPDTGHLWLLRIRTTTGSEDLRLEQYNSTTGAFIQAMSIPMADPSLVVQYNNFTIAPGFKFFMGYFGRSIKQYDLSANTLTTFAGSDTTIGTNDGTGLSARFTSIGSLRYSAPLGVMLVSATGRIIKVTVPADPNAEYGTGMTQVGNLLFAAPDGSFGNGIAAAQTVADASTQGGYTDWRLPTYAETQALVAQVRAPGLIARGWSAGASDWYWTSTVQGGANYYVYAPGQTGGSPIGFSFGTGNYRVMLVRNL